MFIRKMLLEKYKEIINSLEEENADLKAENYKMQVELMKLKEKKSTTRRKKRKNSRLIGVLMYGINLIIK